MANPYGRKGKGTPATSAEAKDPDQKAMMAVLMEENERLRQALINIETAKAGSVALIEGNTDRIQDMSANKPAPRITYGGNKEPALGKKWMVRVYSDKAPAGVRIPETVQMAGPRDRNGNPYQFKRRFYTDTLIELPEDVIKHLEYPEIREYKEETGSDVYEAAMRGNMGPAEEACRKMNFEKVVWKPDGLYYITEIRHITVSKEYEVQEKLTIPAGAI